jgi:hypothetical protein
MIGHTLGARISEPSGNAGPNGKVSCRARCSIDLLSRSGKPCSHVFRQGKQGAYRYRRQITIRPGLTSRIVEISGLPRDPAVPAVGKNDPDPADPPTRLACADRKPLTVKRVGRIDDPHAGWQPFRS